MLQLQNVWFTEVFKLNKVKGMKLEKGQTGIGRVQNIKVLFEALKLPLHFQIDFFDLCHLLSRKDFCCEFTNGQRN